MRARSLPAFIIAAAVVVPAPFGFGADPNAGVIGLQNRTVRWTGSFAAAANAASFATGAELCANPMTKVPNDPAITAGPTACDVFTLSVKVPARYWTWPRGGGVAVRLDGFGENDDLDLAVHVRNPDGTVGPRVAGSAKDLGVPEVATIREAAGDYYIFAIGFAVASSSYNGTATLVEQSGPAAGTLGRVFEPHAPSEALYAIQAPDQDPARQRHIVEAADGADLFVETWLPKSKPGRVVPQKVPTILVMTPYVMQGVEEYQHAIDYFVPRGYAVAQHNVRGSGESGGCLEQTGPSQIDDGARVVEYLGRDAPWTDGNVGMYGISYDAETQLSVAGLGDPQKTKYLKAIIPAASVGGQYEYSYFDGVPYLGFGLESNLFYLGLTSAIPGETSTPAQYVEKLQCQPEVMEASLDQSGDMTPYYQERELRPGASNIRAATLMVHGLADFNVLPLTEAGFFERLPKTTPHKGLFGIWEHAFPDSHSIRSEWSRTDWLPMALAWYERYLKGVDSGVEDWPAVQVQGNDGQWRAEPSWPTTGGPAGQLALGPNGKLGVATPDGSTSYIEQTDKVPAPVVAGAATFETGALPERLEITGQPVLDAWISLDQPDAHLVAIIETFDAAGKAIIAGTDFGMRSARHLDPLVENRFAQAEGKPAPVNTPLDVEIRFLPTDLVVPKGGNLRLTISAANPEREEPTPSGSPTTVTILHDCEHTSVLRFLTPRRIPDLLRVRDVRPATKAVTPPKLPVSDAAGLVSAPVCGKAPLRLPSFGPVIDQLVAPAATSPPPASRPRPKVLSGTLPATGVAPVHAGPLLLAAAGLLAAGLRRSRRG